MALNRQEGINSTLYDYDNKMTNLLKLKTPKTEFTHTPSQLTIHLNVQFTYSIILYKYYKN